MALTKVSGGILDPGINVAGIVTATGFDGPFTGGSSSNINAGIITATGFDLNGNGDISGNLVIGGNLTANGDFTTLNTTLREVEILRVDADTTAVAGIITQRGSGDILRLYDTNAQIVTVADGGNVTLKSTNPVVNIQGTNASATSEANLNFILRDGNSADRTIGKIVGRSDGNGGYGSLDFYTAFDNTNYNRMSINKDGEVGIGTDDPQQKLHVYGSGNQLIMLQSTTTANAQLQLKTSQRTYNLENVTGGTLQIRDGSVGSTRLSINSSGTVTVNNVLNVNTRANVGGTSVGFTPHNTSWATAAAINLKGNYSGGISFNDNDNSGYSVYADGNGANFHIKNGAVGGSLKQSIKCIKDEGVELYHNDNKVAFTGQDALYVYGRTSNSGMVEIASNQAANNNDRFRIHKTSGASRLTIQNYSTGSWVENIRFNSDGEVSIATGSNTTNRLTFGGGINIYHDGNMKFENGTGYLKLQCNNAIYIDGSALYFRNAGGTNRWQINSSGHFLPGAVGSYNIGSTGAEIGDVYLADDKRVYFGTDQDLSIYSSGSDSFFENSVGHTYFRNSSGTSGGLLFRSDGETHISNYAANEYRIKTFNQGAVELFFAAGTYSTPKLKTTATGVTVDGEVAASQDYPNFRPTLDLNFAATKKLDSRITYRRTGVASFVNKFGKVVKVGGDTPRFDHDPVTRECKGLLIEESRTNVAEVSEDFGNTSFWSPTNQTITTNVATAPDGTLTADNVVPASGNTALRYLYFSVSAYPMSTSTTYTTSIFVKKNGLRYFAFQAHDNGSGSGHRAGFDLDNGTVVTSNNMGSASGHSASIVEFPNGWFRCILTGTTASSGSTGKTAFSFSSALDGNASVGAITADGSSGGYVWGHQVEAGSYATSYIPTTLSTATRGVDIALIDGEELSEFYNPIESTILVDYTHDFVTSSNLGGSARLYRFRAVGGSDTRIDYVSNTNNEPYIASDGTNVANISNGQSTVFGGGVNKTAIRVKEDSFASSFNGSSAVEDTSGAWNPSNAITEVAIGSQSNSGGNPLNGHIRRFVYYSTGLPNSQLVTLTS